MPDQGLMADLLWADPAENPLQMGWERNDRGVSFTFGSDVVQAFCQRHDVDLIVRAH